MQTSHLRSIVCIVRSQAAAAWFKAFVVLAMYVLMSANVFWSGTTGGFPGALLSSVVMRESCSCALLAQLYSHVWYSHNGRFGFN